MGIDFSIDIFTRHRISSKNIDQHFWAHSWHSVSVMGHKQGFELAVPEIQNFENLTNYLTFLTECLILVDCECSYIKINYKCEPWHLSNFYKKFKSV